MGRRNAREALLALMYEYDVVGEKGHETLQVMGDVLSQSLNDSDDKYIEKGYNFFMNKSEEIDEIIKASLTSWDIERLSRVDVSIMRLAVIDMKYFDDIPRKVAINEAVELAKRFSSDKAPKFINGVLAGCTKVLDSEWFILPDIFLKEYITGFLYYIGNIQEEIYGANYWWQKIVVWDKR